MDKGWFLFIMGLLIGTIVLIIFFPLSDPVIIHSGKVMGRSYVDKMFGAKYSLTILNSDGYRFEQLVPLDIWLKCHVGDRYDHTECECRRDDNG